MVEEKRAPLDSLIGPTQVLKRQGAEDQLVQQKIHVAVVSGEDQGKEVVLTDDHLLIGTHPSCDFPLKDPSVSRQHALLDVTAEGLLLHDLGSTNGIYLQGVCVHEATLPDFTEVTLGNTRLQIVVLSDTFNIPLSQVNRFGDLMGDSPVMRALFAKLARIAQTHSTVLLLGESGTGKEIAARAIHDHSSRAQGPFIVVDCGALPRDLIESELFGHERGAFTGALHSRPGAFELAHTGTLFLDEIGELDLELQPRLLRALESRTVKRVGGNQQRSVDIRVIAGTNRNLEHRVAEGVFREDLFYRLAVVQITMPALRHHKEDIPLLVKNFIEQLSPDNASVHISNEMLERLMQRIWPGNVRELRNVVERALALQNIDNHSDAFATLPGKTDPEKDKSATPLISAQLDLPYKVVRAQLLEDFERRYLTALLERHQGNLTQAARSAQIDRVYLLRLLDKYGMRKRS